MSGGPFTPAIGFDQSGLQTAGQRPIWRPGDRSRTRSPVERSTRPAGALRNTSIRRFLCCRLRARSARRSAVIRCSAPDCSRWTSASARIHRVLESRRLRPASARGVQLVQPRELRFAQPDHFHRHRGRGGGVQSHSRANLNRIVAAAGAAGRQAGVLMSERIPVSGRVRLSPRDCGAGGLVPRGKCRRAAGRAAGPAAGVLAPRRRSTSQAIGCHS